MQKLMEYFTLLRDLNDDYFDVWHILFSSIKYTFIGLFLAILLLIVARKYIFVKRVNKFLATLKYLYIFLIPTFFMISFFVFGLLGGIKNELITKEATYQKILQEKIDSSFTNKTLELNNSPLGNATIEQTLNNALPKIKEIMIEKLSANSTKTSEFLIQILSKTDILDGFIKSEMKNMLVNQPGIDKEIIDRISNATIHDFADAKFLIGLVSYKAHKTLNTLNVSIIAIFIFVILLIFIEVFFANKKLKKATLPNFE